MLRLGRPRGHTWNGLRGAGRELEGIELVGEDDQIAELLVVRGAGGYPWLSTSVPFNTSTFVGIAASYGPGSGGRRCRVPGWGVHNILCSSTQSLWSARAAEQGPYGHISPGA
jgi:hypothetical protein